MSFKIIAGQRSRIHSLLIIGSVLLGLLTLPVMAQGSVIDLELGGEGAVSWGINNIKPGDRGIKTIELRNTGTLDGFVTLWINDINESDHGGNGANLDNYLLFNLSSEGMETNVSFPSNIYDLPQNVSESKYLIIGPLGKGEASILDLKWEFQMTGTSQNDAQGDELSFSINFMLEELPLSEGESHDENETYDHHKSHDDDTRLKITSPAEPEISEENISDEHNDAFYQNLTLTEQAEPLFDTEINIERKDYWASFTDNKVSYIPYIVFVAGSILLRLVQKRRRLIR